MKKIGLVLFPGFQVIDLAALSVFEMANLQSSRPAYEIRVLSVGGGGVTSSLGASVLTERLGPTPYDTLMVAGATVPVPSVARLLDLLSAASPRARRTASICTGAFVLAEAGILDGRRVTTHWHHARELQRLFPSVRVEEDRIFLRDGQVWTSAGMSAGIDLALALVEEDLGVEISRAVAKKLVVHHRRAGGQSQFSSISDVEAKSDRMQSALSFAKNHLHEDLSIARLADVVHMSPRHFSRAFRINTGQSPARAIERLRAETARLLVESGLQSVDRIAQQTGFSDGERMRRAFLRLFGQPPQALKRAAKARLAADVQALTNEQV